MTVRELLYRLQLEDDQDAEVFVFKPDTYGEHQSRLAITAVDRGMRNGEECIELLTEGA